MKKLTSHDVTPEEIFYQRRKIIKAFGLSAVATALPTFSFAQESSDLKALEYKKSTESTLILTPKIK